MEQLKFKAESCSTAFLSKAVAERSDVYCKKRIQVERVYHENVNES